MLWMSPRKFGFFFLKKIFLVLFVYTCMYMHVYIVYEHICVCMYMCVYVCMLRYMPSTMHMWKSEDTLWYQSLLPGSHGNGGGREPVMSCIPVHGW